MANRTSGTRRPAPQRRQASGSREIDRYHYVDRDIYSHSRHAPPPRRRKKRKKRKSPLRRFFTGVLLLLVVFVVGAAAYGGLLLSRLDRPAEVDTSQYEEQPSAAPTWSVLSDSKVMNILLIGKDKGDDGKSSRSDTTMLLSIDTENKQLKLVSFLRDMYLEIPTVGKTRFNSAYANGGAALTMQTLENNFRVELDKYVEVDFETFALVIDKMGGIDIDMNAKVAAEGNKNIGSHWTEGVNHLSGEEALYYARIRATDSDFGRTGRQRQVVEAMLARFKEMNAIEMNQIVFDLLPNITTNLEDPDILYLLSIAPQVLDYEQVTMHVPNDGTFQDLKLPSGAQVLQVDVEENSRLLREFLYPSATAE
ncbi:MAG TPA: LCP family protein [Candidatus Caccousia avistercoris]|nr:LCP family protein [Candidatus Caccousia avistercoris]